jgi:hypothetical protein
MAPEPPRHAHASAGGPQGQGSEAAPDAAPDAAPPDAAPDALTAALDRLFAAPFDEFVALRREIALGLRKGGDAAAGRTVAAFAKPSRTAWALNQVARRHPALVTQALDAWATAAAAPKAGDADDVRATARAFRERMADVVQAAEGVAREDGSALNVVQGRRIAATLQAIAGGADAAARERLVAGRLAADVDVDDPFAGLEVGPPGLRPRVAKDEMDGGTDVSVPAASHARGQPQAPPRGQVHPAPARPAREEMAAKRAAAHEAERARAREKREKEAEEVRARVAALEGEARQARAAAREAEVAATRAQADADRARRAVDMVERKLEEARGELRSLVT